MNIKKIVLLGVVFLSAACTAAPPGASDVKPVLPINKIGVKQNEEKVYTEVKDGLEFTVTLNKALFTLQDEITIQVKVTNVSDHDIHSFTGVASDGYVSAGISDAQKFFWLAASTPSEYDIVAPQVMAQGNLRPGASIEYERVLLPKINLGTEQVEAWSGDYLVSAGYWRNLDDTVAVSFPITIESDAAKLMLPEAAEKAAYESEAYKEWFAAHSGKAVAWLEAGVPYVVIKGELVAADQAYCEQVLAECETPSQSTHFENGNWVVNSCSYYGNAPLGICIKVDAVKGNIVSTEYPTLD
jgi:hypothetical protein